MNESEVAPLSLTVLPLADVDTNISIKMKDAGDFLKNTVLEGLLRRGLISKVDFQIFIFSKNLIIDFFFLHVSISRNHSSFALFVFPEWVCIFAYPSMCSALHIIRCV